MSRILVTGGAGFIGSNLVAKLVDQGHDIVVFDNESRGSFRNVENNSICMIKGDITKYEDWKQIPSDVDSIFHLAAINGTRFFYEIPEKVLEVNIKGVLNMIEFVKEYGIKDVLFASSSEVYGSPIHFPTSESEELKIPDPLNPRYSYSGSKIIGELICINYARRYDFKYTIIRYHNVYGPKMGHEHVIPEFVRKLARNEAFVVEGDGTESRSFCYIDDAVDGTLIAHSSNVKDRIFNVGNPEEVSIASLIELLVSIARKKITPEYTTKSYAGTRRRVPDISKLRSIGYEPRTPLEQGLRTTYDWYYNYYLDSNR